MGIVHIFRRRNRLEIPLGISNAEPCRRQSGQSLRIRNGFEHIAVGIRVIHIMPRHIDRFIHTHVAVFWFYKIYGCRFRDRLSQSIGLDIAYNSVYGSNLLPVSLIL